MTKHRSTLTLGILILMASTLQQASVHSSSVFKMSAANPKPSQGARAQWKEFSSKQGGFSVLMPGEPQEETEVKEFPVVGKGQVHLFSVAADSGLYLVSYLDIPGLARQNQAFCDSFGKGFLKTIGEGTAKGARGTVVKDIDITMGSNPGKETLIQVPAGLATSRAYFIKRRGYQLIAAPSGTGGAGEVKKFLDSFKVISQ